MKFRHLAALTAATAAMALAFTPGVVSAAAAAPFASAASNTNGAFAYSAPQYYSVVDAFGKTATAADAAAVAKCRADGNADCIPVAWFRHGYGTFAISEDDNAFAWAVKPSLEAADNTAVEKCEGVSGGGLRLPGPGDLCAGRLWSPDQRAPLHPGPGLLGAE